MEFSPALYGSIGPDLRIGRQAPDEPNSWVGARRVREEPTETLLALNLKALTGLPLAWVRFSGAMDPSVDLVATDPLGRVHLFELKKASVGAQEATQLEQYLLRHVFDDSRAFLTDSLKHGRQQSERDPLARRVTGLFANERIVSFGSRNLVRLLGPDHHDAQAPGGRSLTSYQWSKLSSAEQTRRIHAALAARTRRDDWPDCLDLSMTLQLARRLSGQLRRALSQIQSALEVQRPIVLWLVGRTIQDPALDRVRMWRRAGLDARVLFLEVRRTDSGWLVRVRHEQAEQRRTLERRLFELQAPEEKVRPTVRLHLYDEASASSSHGHGGNLLPEPYARIIWPNGAQTKVTP